jgi:hypothetical protein
MKKVLATNCLPGYNGLYAYENPVIGAVMVTLQGTNNVSVDEILEQ